MNRLIVVRGECEIFTKAEIDELGRIADGLNVRDSATKVGRSEKTIETHRWRIASKLRTRGTTGILIESLRIGLIVLERTEVGNAPEIQ